MNDSAEDDKRFASSARPAMRRRALPLLREMRATFIYLIAPAGARAQRLRV